ncbi:MAG: UbiD family decarboxylase [Candidatus Methanomethyliaceae archaeon]|nr:UbiD family decarboxylase [Candidatus Methanomethyliaceae archaeon]MDW7970498.1 UbiD family decarboxylase [Nitrososphaerota archaeon]
MRGENDILEFQEELSPKYEIPAIMEKYDGGPILLFNKVKGKLLSIASGICGKRERVLKSINATKYNYYEKMIDAINNPLKPKIVNSNFEIEEEDLSSLPILTHYERDAGPYITSGIVIAKSKFGFQNASIHRLLLLDKKHMAIRIVPRHLYAIYQEAKKNEEDLKIAIVIGVHPAVLVGVNTSPKYGVDELWVANRLMNGELKVVECKTSDLLVPADAEILIEGVIKKDEFVDEGPFVDITGTYDIVRKQPVVEIKKVLRRRDAIYYAILPGGLEHKLLMGMPKEAKMYDAISKIIPEVKGVRLTIGGCCWFNAIVSIKKQSEGDGKSAILAAFGSNPSLKHVVVVDEDIDIDDMNEVEWAIATRFQGDEDLIIVRNARGSSLDPSSDQERLITCKVGIDATIPWNKPREKFEKAKWGNRNVPH